MKSKGVAYVLLIFLGWLGIHKFYVGKVGMGVVYILLLVSGFLLWIPWILLVIGLLIDLFILGSQVDTCNLAQSNRNLLNQTAMLTQGTANLSARVAANQSQPNAMTMQNRAIGVPTPPPAPNQSNNQVEQLRKLKSLLDAGILTQEEFEAEKQKILNS